MNWDTTKPFQTPSQPRPGPPIRNGPLGAPGAKRRTRVARPHAAAIGTKGKPDATPCHVGLYPKLGNRDLNPD